MDHLSKARRVIGIEADELRRLAENLDGQAFSRAIETLKTCVDHRGKIVVCGVGKSGHIGDKIAATLTSTLALVIPHVKSGKLRGLGITSVARSPVLPEVPTIAEAGVPGYEAVQWSGFFAPAGTPREIVARLNKEMVSILHLPIVQERLAAEIATINTSTPEQFGAYLKSEIAKWTKAVQVAGIQPE